MRVSTCVFIQGSVFRRTAAGAIRDRPQQNPLAVGVCCGLALEESHVSCSRPVAIVMRLQRGQVLWIKVAVMNPGHYQLNN